jgi:hypothetical protein
MLLTGVQAGSARLHISLHLPEPLLGRLVWSPRRRASQRVQLALEPRAPVIQEVHLSPGVS